LDAFGSVLGWLALVTGLMAILTMASIVAGIVGVAAAGGGFAGRPIPAGVAKRAERVEARIRARYAGGRPSAPMLTGPPDGGSEASGMPEDPPPTEIEPLLAA
jgi:hypothetical protein